MYGPNVGLEIGRRDLPAQQLSLNLTGHNIAAGLNGETGDNANALNIAALRDQLLMRKGQATFNEYYGSIIGKVGVKSKEAQNHEANQLALLSQIDNSRESLSGVSLDEEMANMIQFQHAYKAAARVITVMDSAPNTVINEMGPRSY